MTDLFDGKEKKFLHVAPERCFESKFRSLLGKSYLTVDLLNEQVMEKMDITDIQYHDEYFDVIYCSHVLEHVIEDKKALREFYRTLKTSGWAVILVPITADKTLEDFSIVTPAERLKVYGQEDHVRRYGPDFKDRLIEAGFSVKVIIPSDIVEKKEIERMGLTSASGDIYYCRKGISS